MNYSQMAASYRNANETVQKTRQVVLLYDAVIRFLQQSKTAIESQDYEQRYNLLQKSSNIILGLSSALDYDNGGEISQILGNFYNAMDLRILGINRSNSIDDLEKIIKEIKIMRDAWHEIDSQGAVKNAEAEIAKALPVNAEGTSDFSA